MQAVVITPGRTGSQLIVTNLQSQGISTVHSHDPLWEPHDASWTCLLSHRRDLFASIASTLVGVRTKEYNVYTGKKIDAFEVSKTEFENCFWFYKCFYHAIDRSKFSTVIDVWYENMMDDPKYLFALLGKDQSMSYNFPKSPYKYQELILNADECRQWFDELNQKPVTDDLINSFKATIKSDLHAAQQ